MQKRKAEADEINRKKAPVLAEEEARKSAVRVLQQPKSKKTAEHVVVAPLPTKRAYNRQPIDSRITSASSVNHPTRLSASVLPAISAAPPVAAAVLGPPNNVVDANIVQTTFDDNVNMNKRRAQSVLDGHWEFYNFVDQLVSITAQMLRYCMCKLTIIIC